MKKMKNAMLVMLGGLLFMTIVQSCKKDDGGTPAAPKPTVTSFLPIAARTGEIVTITGTNFTGATAVSFGGTAATAFTVVNATTITATVGAGATGAVAVTSAGGTGSLTGFTFNATLPPVNGYNSSNEVEADGLIAYWPFDGNAVESKHGAAPVRSGGASSYVTGVIGQAVSLNNGWFGYDPNATGASAPNTPPGNSNDTLQLGFTLSLWAQVPDTSLLTNLFQLCHKDVANWPILGLAYRRHNGGMEFDLDGGLTNIDGTGTHPTYDKAFVGNAFNDSLSWAFLAMTYSPGVGDPGAGGTPAKLRYYANGILRATVDLNPLSTNPFPDPAAALLMIAPNYAVIGSFEGTDGAATPNPRNPGTTNVIPGFMSYGITGKLDEIRLFKRQLTDIQVESLFILGNQGR
jgi:hypothetical protein